jgi:coproporphyrinogen III oxidase
MTRIYAKSPHATAARELVEGLQTLFVAKLEALSAELGSPERFERVDWVRDGGAHGGGHRYVLVETPLFNRAAVNVSGVHYDDDPDKRLASADALSTIIHPQHPLAPSVHMHFSWTEMRDGSGYYRMMADLNPSIEDPMATQKFRHALREAAPKHCEEAEVQGDHYFNIPALRRHRGATHFYLEAFRAGHFDDDTAMARQVAEAAIDSYIEILGDALRGAAEPTADQRNAQLAYHTAYLFQVLTLDRGTTSGLLVHDQNDQGIMGSLPAYVDRALLDSWAQRLQAPQDGLVHRLVAALEDAQPSHVTPDSRLALAAAVRAHYKEHPEALALQAKGSIVPPTLDNHS